MNTKLINHKESQPLIRHCLNYSIYGKKLKTTSYKEKFVNFLMKDGKKSKAYKIFNEVGIIIKKKLTNNEKQIFFFNSHKEGLQKIKYIYFELTKDSKKESNFLPSGYHKKGKQTNNEKKNKQQNKNSIKISSIQKQKIASFNALIVQAIENVRPSLEVRKVRIAGTTYLVPAIIPKNRQQTLAIKWLIQSARLKKRTVLNTFAQNLANELLDASKRTGQARQKRDELHKIAEANRAYIRYRWW